MFLCSLPTKGIAEIKGLNNTGNPVNCSLLVPGQSKRSKLSQAADITSGEKHSTARLLVIFQFPVESLEQHKNYILSVLYFLSSGRVPRCGVINEE